MTFIHKTLTTNVKLESLPQVKLNLFSTLSNTPFSFVQVDKEQTHTNKTRNNHRLWASTKFYNSRIHKRIGMNLPAWFLLWCGCKPGR